MTLEAFGRPASASEAPGAWVGAGVGVAVGVDAVEEVPLCSECAMLPRCDYCQLPSDMKTDGGDRLCRDCAKDCIKVKSEAEKVMKDVRQVLNAKFKMTTKHKIIYEIGNTTSSDGSTRRRSGTSRSTRSAS